MINAYSSLHELGLAHSIEAYQENELVGGLYGVSLGKSFFGESMFSKIPNSSKAALISLCFVLQNLKFDIIDTQVHTEHLESMGAEFISRNDFLFILEKSLKKETLKKNWNYLFENFQTSDIIKNN